MKSSEIHRTDFGDVGIVSPTSMIVIKRHYVFPCDYYLLNRIK